jgi:hypothetical protein
MDHPIIEKAPVGAEARSKNIKEAPEPLPESESIGNLAHTAAVITDRTQFPIRITVRDELPAPQVRCVEGPDPGTSVYLFPTYSYNDSDALCCAGAVLWEGGVRSKQVLPILVRLWRRRLLPPMAMLIGAFFDGSVTRSGINIAFDLPESELLASYRFEIARLDWAWPVGVAVSALDDRDLLLCQSLNLGVRYAPGSMPPDWEPGVRL